MTINDFMLTEIFSFLLILCRVGSAIMLLPGFGESYISARVRLLLAAMFALVLVPALGDFPAPPDNVPTLLKMVIGEIIIGIFLGVITRMLIATISTAGMIIAYQSSLASALVQDVTLSGGQGSSLGNLLGITALTLLFVTDMHHLMLGAIVDSYQLFHVGIFPAIEGMNMQVVRVMNASFLMALQLAAPHIAIGIILYLAAGIIARLMPNLQVFFILVPPQLLLSFFLLFTVFNAMMIWYMEYFQSNITQLTGQ